MPFYEKRGKKKEAQGQDTNEDFIEGIDDLDDDIRSQLPSQDHCMWLVNIIQIHAKKVAKNLLREHEETVLAQLRNEIQGLKQENEQLKKSLNDQENTIKKLKWSRDGINKDLAKKNREFESLRSHVDQIDQKQKETRVRIAGIPEEDNEDLSKKVFKLTKNKLGLKKMKENNIIQVYRSGKKKSSKTRDVIVEFDSRPIRDSVHGARKKLINPSETDKSIFINDDLTEFRLKLFHDARILVKKKKLRAAWSQHGNVMVLQENGGPKAVYNHSDLRAKAGLDYFGDSDSISIHMDVDDSSMSLSETLSSV